VKSPERPLEGSVWRAKAACKGLPLEWFFPDAEDATKIATVIARAKRVCARCEVQLDCREYAINAAIEFTSDLYGIWGGLTQSEIRQEAKRRTR